MRTLSSAIGALGFACAAGAGTPPLPSDFESVRIIKVWEPSGQRLAPPIGTVVADFNRDSKPDIVSLTADESFIALGDGSGGFASPITLPFRGSALATADFNDDSNPDLAFTSPAGVYVAQGGGNAAFAPAALVFAATNPTAIAVGDFNADTLSDLVWRDDTGVHVAIRTGPSSFSSPSFVTTTPGDLIVGPIDAVPGDDLAIGAAVFYARPGAPFESGPTLPTDRIAAVADMDADADADLIVESIGPAPSFAASLAIARNDSGAFTLEPATPLNDPGPHHLTIADFDASGTLDAAAASSRSYLQSSSVTVGRRVIVLLNQEGALRFHTSLMSGGAVADTLTSADLDADDRPDLVVSNRGARFMYTPTGEAYRYGRSVAALFNGPGADFRSPQVLKFNGAPTQPPIAWDVDDDGDLDVVHSLQRGNERLVLVRRNLGQGRFADLDVFIAGPSGDRVLPTSARIGDWNADGQEELLLGVSSWTAVVHKDTSITSPVGFDQEVALRAESVEQSSWPSLGLRDKSVIVDLNGDLVEDVVQYASRHPGHPAGLLVAIARPGMPWETHTLFENEHVDAVAVRHLDQRPGVDLAVAVRGKWDSLANRGLNYRMHILSNDGLGAFTSLVDFPIGDDVTQIVSDPFYNEIYVSGVNFIRRVRWSASWLWWRVDPLGVNFAPIGDPIVQLNRQTRPGIVALSQRSVDGPASLFAFAEDSSLQTSPIDVAPLPWGAAHATSARLNNDLRDDLILTDARYGDLWCFRREYSAPPPPPQPCYADTNADNFVDGRDLNNIIQSIRFQTPVTPDCDLNHDSLVDGRDLSILLARFGSSCPSNPAP